MSRFLLLLPLALAGPLLAEDWPAWRGPRGDGTSLEKDVPTRWSTTENVRWKAKLPGPGNSSPVVSGDRVFLTQALDKDGHDRAVLCFDRKTGARLWQKAITYKPKEKEPTHGTNPYCAATPATDGARVVAWHGSAGVVCYDTAGKQLWHRDLGEFRHVWGTASSPVIHGELVLLNCGPGPRTFLIALDKKTGRDVWKVDEPGGHAGLKKGDPWVGSWSTPRVVSVKGQEQVLVSWPKAVKAYGLKKGELLWTCQGLTDLVYTSVVTGPDVAVAMSGYHGSALAVKLGGSGDVTETHRLWLHKDKPPQRIGTGVVVGEHLYMANADPNGTLQCFELKTGKNLWKGHTLGAAAWGSLVLADGRLYVTDQRGTTHVFKAAPKFELVSRNRLGESCNATPAISQGEIFIRTFDHLWCLGPPKD